METFGRYELIKKIATGGMAEIYLARQAGIEGFEKLLVLKRILPHLAESDEFVEMFLHEARVAVRLNHPNIVQIFDLGEIDGAFFIAMEYIHGEDTRRIWRQSELAGNPMPVPLVCRVIMDAAAGLDYAHKRCDASGAPLNIIHRDVSPQNLLVSFEGAVKVVDFGIAKAADQATQTRSGVLKGKYSYMSPEQASGKEIDQRTDQFALGVVFYELLTLKRLFKRGNDIQTLAAVTDCKVPPPSEVNPRVPQDLDPIVLRVLSRNPDERYRDLQELQLAIEQWLLSHQQLSSAAHLSAFLKSIYAERLAKESESGAPVFTEPSDLSSSVSGRANRRRTNLSTLGRQPSLADLTRNARRGSSVRSADGAGQQALPAAGGDGDDEATPVDQNKSGSSAARRLTIGAFGILALLLLVTGASLLLSRREGPPPGPSTESRQPQGESQPQNQNLPPHPLAGLKVVTVPSGASVVVDGKPQAEQTPLTVAGLELGEHRVFISMRGYADEARTMRLVEAGTIVPLNIELRADSRQSNVSVFVSSSPSGADIAVDGVPSGRTPVTLSLPGGRTVRVELSKDGYVSTGSDLALSENSEQKVSFTLERRGPAQVASGPGTVSIDCEPAAVLWEGKTELGSTPYRGKLSPGRHRLVLVNRELGFERVIPLVVRPGETVARTIKLDQGEVQLVASPWADVYLRGKKVGTTPMPKLTLYEGEHQFILVNPDLGKKKTVTVTVRAGHLEKKTVDMTTE